MRNGKSKRPVEDFANAGKFVCPVGEVRWKCWQITSPVPEWKRRIGQAKYVVAHTAYFAREKAALEFGGRDPLRVEVEQE
jgi:hypothetical protein